MKRRELLQRMRVCGAKFVREGGSHTIFVNPRTQTLIPVPRHVEINDRLAEKILREARATR